MRKILLGLMVSVLIWGCQGSMSSDSADQGANSITTTSLTPYIPVGGGGPNCPAYPFYWNVGTAQTIDFGTYPIVRNQISIHGSNQIGLFADYDFDTSGNITATNNGGIPQEQFYTDGFAAHRAKIITDMNIRLPDVNYNGYIVVDFESYWPIWAMYVDQHYRDASLTFAMNHPELHSEIADLNERTRALFDEAAMAMLVTTIDQIKAIRPNAKGVGYYGFPDRLYWGGYESLDVVPANHIAVTTGYCPAGSTFGDCDRLLNNRMSALWNSQTAFYPSIYQFYPSVEGTPGVGQTTPERNATYITANINEAKRLAGSKPIVPYGWYMYHDSTIYRGQYLNDIDLAQMLTIPDQLGTEGVVMWGWAPTQFWVDSLQNYLDTKMGPFMSQYTQTRCQAQ